MCLAEYTGTTITAEKGKFFFYDNMNSEFDEYRGAQGFRITRTGRYNVTLAGAAGGRGLCNTHNGRGLLWKGQVNLTTEDELLILVGQRGLTPCSSIDYQGIANMVCETPPQTEADSLQCNQTWYEWLSTILGPDDSLVQFYSNNSGGGSGGGASMIRIINTTSGIAEVLPVAVAGGGGGSAVIADYNILNKTTVVIGVPSNATSLEKYRAFMDAKHALFDPTDKEGYGARGQITSDAEGIFRAGAGGSYLTLRNSADTDGGFLRVTENFAEGGFDCGRQIFELSDTHFQQLHGGFGGGGGQCGSGGSGGGFSGGGVFGEEYEIPGQGGFFYYIGNAQLDKPLRFRDVKETEFGMNELDDGFVEVVPENCGCTDQCHIDEKEMTFKCSCQSNGTSLAPNGYDCLKGY